MRREERVTVQGPVKEQHPDGMSHRGWMCVGPWVRGSIGRGRGLTMGVSQGMGPMDPALGLPFRIGLRGGVRSEGLGGRGGGGGGGNTDHRPTRFAGGKNF